MNEVAVKKVSSTDELQEILRKAQIEKTPISLYRKPKAGGVVLDFNAWKDIEVFDMDNLMVIVPPGLTLKELNEVVSAKGLRFIPADTPLLESLSVGEWAYRGCPNPSAWKYGPGKHFLLGSGYVLPNGDTISVGGKCIKNVTGYDLTRFLTGGYADLAIGVRFIIKLMPQPAFRRRYDLNFASLQDAIRLIAQLQNRSVPPSWLYWFDEVSGSQLFGQQQKGHRVLFELDGNEAEVHDYTSAIDSLLTECNGQKAAETGILPDLSFLESEISSFSLMDEFKVPYSAVNSFAAAFANLLREKNMAGGLFGQLADGKIHVTLKQAERLPDINAILKTLQTVAASLGGAASGKYARLYEPESTGPLAVLELAFKRSVDPELIFNRREVNG